MSAHPSSDGSLPSGPVTGRLDLEAPKMGGAARQNSRAVIDYSLLSAVSVLSFSIGRQWNYGGLQHQFLGVNPGLETWHEQSLA